MLHWPIRCEVSRLVGSHGGWLPFGPGQFSRARELVGRPQLSLRIGGTEREGVRIQTAGRLT